MLLQLNQALLDFEAKCKADDAAQPSSDSSAQLQADRTRDRQRQRSELEARLSEARSLQKSYEDAGPVYDVVVWCEQDLSAPAAADSKDSKVASNAVRPVWRAAIDSKQDGDLSAVKGMTNYRLERQWATFSADDRMNYSVNIYVAATPNATPVCSIVVTAGARTLSSHVQFLLSCGLMRFAIVRTARRHTRGWYCGRQLPAEPGFERHCAGRPTHLRQNW